jgi:hypothetical protein
MKGKRKSAVYPLARFIHWLLLAVRVPGGIRLQIVYGTDRVSMAWFFHLKSSRNRLVTWEFLVTQIMKHPHPHRLTNGTLITERISQKIHLNALYIPLQKRNG